MNKKPVILRFVLGLILTYVGTGIITQLLFLIMLGVTVLFSRGMEGATFIFLIPPMVVGKYAGYILPTLIGAAVYRWIFKQSTGREAVVCTLILGTLVPVTNHVWTAHWKSTNLNALVHGDDTPRLIEVIQNEKFDPNTSVPGSETPLLPFILCRQKQHLAAVPILLGKAGVDVNRGLDDYPEAKPLLCAINKHLEQVVRLLLSSPDLIVKVENLNDAIIGGNLEIVRTLLDARKVDINMEAKVRNHYSTPLQAAAHFGKDVELVKLILEVPGIDVNKRAASDRTALMVAIYENHDHIARLLIEDPRIDLRIVNVNNESALDLAKWKKNEVILKLLAEKGIE